MERFEINGVLVEVCATSNSAPPDAPEGGMVLHAFHQWYRINGGEWKGAMNLPINELLLDFAGALLADDEGV